MKIRTKIAVLLGAFTFSLVSCNTFNDETLPDTYSEVPKDISGEWELYNVTRNGIDITKRMDFSSFHLLLNADNTYKLDNYLPFIVKQDGTWSVDDLLYPFHLIFKEGTSQYEVKTEIQYVTRGGKRQLILTLSPGCHTNEYVYTFQKIVGL